MRLAITCQASISSAKRPRRHSQVWLRGVCLGLRFRFLPTAPGKNNDMLKDVLVDGAIGTAVGTGIGALAEVALVAANVTLFIASPLIAPLAMLGWGASLGAVIGAVVGTEKDSGLKAAKKDGKLAELISDAIASGQVVLVAVTRTEQETAMAREVIQASLGQHKELSTV